MTAMTAIQVRNHYLRLYRAAAAILATYNPCHLKSGKCCGTYRDAKGLCCGGCPHLGPKGCKVKSLACKLWLCGGVADSLAERELYRLKLEAIGLGIPMEYRYSLTENMQLWKTYEK